MEKRYLFGDVLCQVVLSAVQDRVLDLLHVPHENSTTMFKNLVANSRIISINYHKNEIT